MGRTYLRSANTQDVSDIDESYANFASYTGINESKSFIDVDQNSFEEANNVYVNIDNELSTRPPVNSYNISGIDSSYDMLDIFKVNGITFYKYLKPFNPYEVDYTATLFASGLLSAGETYDIDDEDCGFEWTDGHDTHESGTVIITFNDGNSYAVAEYNKTVTTNTTSETIYDLANYVILRDDSSKSWSINSVIVLNDYEDVDEFLTRNTDSNYCNLYCYSTSGAQQYQVLVCRFYELESSTTNSIILYSDSWTSTGTVFDLSDCDADRYISDSSNDTCILYVYDTSGSLQYTYFGVYDSDRNVFISASGTGTVLLVVDPTTVDEILEDSSTTIETTTETVTETITIIDTYQLGVNSIYGITWKYGNSVWNNYDYINGGTKVFYIQDWYIFTDGSTIVGYKYDYDTSAWKKYELDELIYVPETTIISGSSVTTDEGALNIFTSAYKETYNLEDSIVTDTSGIDGETVTLTVGDETFTLVWDSDYTSVLSTSLGTITYNVDTIISSIPGSDTPIYVAYCGYWLDVDGNPGFYYSIDGILWAHVTMPEDVVAGSFSATLSEQGWTVWIAKYADEDTTDTATIYYGILPSSIGSTELTISWYTISVTIDDVVNQTSSGDFTINKVYFESSTVIGEPLSTDTGTCTLSTTYKSFALTQNNKVLIKSLEDGSCILHYLLDSYTFDGNVTYTITNDEGNETSTELTSYSDISMLTALRGSSMYYYGTMLVVINSYNVNAYLGTNILEASYNVFNAEDVELDFTHSTDSYSIVSIYGTNYSYRNNIATHRICYALDNYVPIFGISLQSINSVLYPIYSYSVNEHATVINNSVDSVKFSSFLQNDIYTEQICYSYENNSFLQKTSYEVSVTNGTFKDTTNEYDSDTLPRTLTESIETYSTSALSLDNTSSSTIVIPNSASDNFVMYSDSSIDVAMTDTGWYNNKIYTYFEREDVSNYLPIAIYYSDSNYYYVYWSPDNNTLYTTNYGSATVIRMVTATNDNVFTSYDVNALSISFANELYTTTIATQNLLYQATAAPDGSSKLYFRTDSKVELPDTVTGMIYFSQTILAIFVPYTAFEYTASSGDDGIVYYYLYPTKLVLGNREDYDILQSYDGSTIYICTERGMAGLTYETLVSSTEHIFSYLTDNIFTSYKEFDEQPILFCQYVRWIFMYRQDSNICYIYDMSGSSWWKWTLPYNITKIYADTDNDKLLLIMNYKLYYFNFDADDFHDIETIRIDWSFKSQKLHLSAPNNYKHLRWLSVVTTQDTDKMRYKLKFTNYRHWHHMQDSSVVEYEINQLGTMRKKINFVKCNAFQFEISNDKTWKQPEKFVISNISIKYRITEGIR